VRRRDLRRPRLVGVGDADQRHARHRGEDPRVMLAQVADADDGDPQRSAGGGAHDGTSAPDGPGPDGDASR
jgi:hypothetical protein